MQHLPCVLVAAPWNVIHEIESVLTNDFVVVGASTFDTAIHRAAEGVDLIVVCYVFDEMRPYRLLNHLQARGNSRVPVVLVRALPVPLQDSEEQIQESYAALGVAAFFNIAKHSSGDGRAAALGQFADWVRHRAHP